MIIIIGITGASGAIYGIRLLQYLHDINDVETHLIITAAGAENIEYDEDYENDDFSKNLVSRKLEAFLGSYKKDSDAGSIIYDDIATVLTAIEVVAP